MSNNPFGRMAKLLDDRMQDHARQSLTWVPALLGTITSSGLKLDIYKHEITDYLVSEHLTLDLPDFTTTESDGAHTQPGASYGGEHSHQVVTPSKLRPLGVGDRVLVQPVNNGQTFVIVARVVSA